MFKAGRERLQKVEKTESMVNVDLAELIDQLFFEGMGGDSLKSLKKGGFEVREL